MQNQYRNLGDFLKVVSESSPDSTALEIKKLFRLEKYTYKDLGEASRRVATFLKAIGVGKDDRVLIWAPNSPEWVSLYFGILFLGAVVVPVDPRTTGLTVKKFVRSATPKVAFRSKFLEGRFSGLVEQEFFVEDLNNVLEKYKPLPWEENKASVDSIAEIVFTSGTTSEPKGVMLTHKNIVANLTSLKKMFPATHFHRFLSILPLSHMYEQMVGLLGPLSVGARITYLPRINSLTVARTVRESQITAFIAVPQVLDLLLDGIERKVKEVHSKWWWDVSLQASSLLPFMWVRRLLFYPIHRFFGGRLEFIAVGGAPLDLRLAKTWELLGVRILQGYGTTEASPLISLNTLDLRKLDSVGKIVPCVEIKISPFGEILARGDSITAGYWQDKKATKEAFTKGWYKTGDIGYLDNEGFLYIKGREKFMIALPDGKKAYPEDIEKKLNEHPAVKDATVLGLKREGKESVHAVLILAKRADPKTILADVNKKLEAHQQITSFSLWPSDDFPRTHTLKVNRKEVFETVTSGSKIIKKTSDKVSTDDKLIEIIASLCNKQPLEITPNKNLVADLGLDSLSRLELVALIEEEIGVSISESSIGPTTTVGNLKDLITKAESVERAAKFGSWSLWKPIKLIRLLLQKCLLFPLIDIFVLLEIKNREIFAKIQTPTIFIFNHTSHFDAPVVIRILPSKLRWNTAVAAAQDYFFTNHLLGSFVSLFLNAFPFNRNESVRPSLEHMGELLDLGYHIVIAPEGTRSINGKLQPFKVGTGFMAVAMGVPVVPIRLQGLHEVLPKGKAVPRFRRVRAIIGQPIVFDKKTSYLEATKALEAGLRSLS